MQEDPNKITFFAETNSRGTRTPFGIKRKDRARHMYVIGKTGMGKSTLLENMAIQDIRNGEGVAFIDPHGATADRLLEYIPEHRMKDVLYFAPFDMDFPVAFNVMEDVGYDKRHLVVSGLLSAFRKIWVDAWSARMEYILSNTLLALLEHPGSTLLDVNRMLIDKNFRKKVVGYRDKSGQTVHGSVKDPIVLSFWLDEFANYTDRYTQDATPAIQNKVGQFTSNPLIRNIIGQPKSSFDIRKMMDEKKILIMNLSKGRVGEVNATLLGSMLVTKIYLAAMSRADVPMATLQPLPSFYFYVDEFQTFANESFADILSEARKYKLNLIIAHQYVEQMEEEVRDAVFGNVGTTVAFRVGPFDAEVLETIFKPQFTETDLVNLGFAQIYLTLMIDGVGSPPFSATTLAPFELPPERFTDLVIDMSRRQFARSRIEVEAAIAKWTAVEIEPPKPRNEAAGNGDYRRSAPRPAERSAEPRRAPAPHSSPGAPAPRAERPPEHDPYPRPRDPEGEKERIASLHTAAQAPRTEEVRKPLAPHTPEERPRQNPRPHQSEHPPKDNPGNPAEERPPLEGATSLRDALLQATGKKSGGGVHAPDLKSTLGKVAPGAAAHAHPQKKEEEHMPPGLPEQELRGMLKVDEDQTKGE